MCHQKLLDRFEQLLWCEWLTNEQVGNGSKKIARPGRGDAAAHEDHLSSEIGTPAPGVSHKKSMPVMFGIIRSQKMTSNLSPTLNEGERV